MDIFEIIMIPYIVIGTYFLNILRAKFADRGRGFALLYLGVSLFMAVWPFAYLKYIAASHSALEVVLVGVAVFWFSIVGGRKVTT